MCNDTTVSKLKNDFHYTLSKFSHELRNPLTLINSGLQMIASAHPEVKEYEHWDDVMDNLDYVKNFLMNFPHLIMQAMSKEKTLTPAATSNDPFLHKTYSGLSGDHT